MNLGLPGGYILKSIYNDSTLTKLHRCRMTKTDL